MHPPRRRLITPTLLGQMCLHTLLLLPMMGSPMPALETISCEMVADAVISRIRQMDLHGGHLQISEAQESMQEYHFDWVSEAQPPSQGIQHTPRMVSLLTDPAFLSGMLRGEWRLIRLLPEPIPNLGIFKIYKQAREAFIIQINLESRLPMRISDIQLDPADPQSRATLIFHWPDCC